MKKVRLRYSALKLLIHKFYRVIFGGAMRLLFVTVAIIFFANVHASEVLFDGFEYYDKLESYNKAQIERAKFIDINFRPYVYNNGIKTKNELIQVGNTCVCYAAQGALMQTYGRREIDRPGWLESISKEYSQEGNSSCDGVSFSGFFVNFAEQNNGYLLTDASKYLLGKPGSNIDIAIEKKLGKRIEDKEKFWSVIERSIDEGKVVVMNLCPASIRGDNSLLKSGCGGVTHAIRLIGQRRQSDGSVSDYYFIDPTTDGVLIRSKQVVMSDYYSEDTKKSYSLQPLALRQIGSVYIGNTIWKDINQIFYEPVSMLNQTGFAFTRDNLESDKIGWERLNALFPELLQVKETLLSEDKVAYAKLMSDHFNGTKTKGVAVKRIISYQFPDGRVRTSESKLVLIKNSQGDYKLAPPDGEKPRFTIFDEFNEKFKISTELANIDAKERISYFACYNLQRAEELKLGDRCKKN